MDPRQRQAALIIPVSLLLMHPNLLIFEDFQSDWNFAKRENAKGSTKEL